MKRAHHYDEVGVNTLRTSYVAAKIGFQAMTDWRTLYLYQENIRSSLHQKPGAKVLNVAIGDTEFASPIVVERPEFLFDLAQRTLQVLGISGQ
jgi:hypothetical protein